MSVAFIPQQKSRPTLNPNQIQKMLDENTHLIQCIVDYQNKGKGQECLQYQQQLHRNLVFLASIADTNPNINALLPPPQTFIPTTSPMNNRSVSPSMAQSMSSMSAQNSGSMQMPSHNQHIPQQSPQSGQPSINSQSGGQHQTQHPSSQQTSPSITPPSMVTDSRITPPNATNNPQNDNFIEGPPQRPPSQSQPLSQTPPQSAQPPPPLQGQSSGQPPQSAAPHPMPPNTTQPQHQSLAQQPPYSRTMAGPHNMPPVGPPPPSSSQSQYGMMPPPPPPPPVSQYGPQTQPNAYNYGSQSPQFNQNYSQQSNAGFPYNYPTPPNSGPPGPPPPQSGPTGGYPPPPSNQYTGFQGYGPSSVNQSGPPPPQQQPQQWYSQSGPMPSQTTPYSGQTPPHAPHTTHSGGPPPPTPQTYSSYSNPNYNQSSQYSQPNYGNSYGPPSGPPQPQNGGYVAMPNAGPPPPPAQQRPNYSQQAYGHYSPRPQMGSYGGYEQSGQTYSGYPPQQQ